MKRNADIKYDYKSLSVPGGGFVTGFVFHPTCRNLLYCRTDIGGVYRFDFESQSWNFLGSRITEFEHHLTQPLAIAVDEALSDKLYIMCGNSRKGAESGRASLLVSNDRGNSFVEKPVPFCCNGNAPARSTAERLACKKGCLFFGSQGDGLWCSRDEGGTWTKLNFCEDNIVFVYFPQDSNIMLISCTGETCADGNNRGHTLYVSYDMGNSFEKLYTPPALNDERCFHNGFVAGGIASCANAVYITFSHSFRKNLWGGWNDFSCDNGGGFDGRVYRYLLNDGLLEFDKDITPSIDGFIDTNSHRRLPFALGGIDACGDQLAVCSIGGHGDAIFISKDGGESYKHIKSTDISSFKIDVPYLKPEYNGGRIPLHWMSCLRFDPFNTDFAVFNTGTGVFTLNRITSETSYISTLCRGIEETVHMNIYGIPDGKNLVIDLVGDLGGFAFSQLESPCENSFADSEGHRYITCLNADFVQNSPDIFVVAARGNWTGHTKGGAILTNDGGDSFAHIGYPAGFSEKLDVVIEAISRPNTNSGWVAVTADGSTILWTLAYQWGQLPCFAAVKYDISSKQFMKIRVYDTAGNDISESEHHIKMFTDRTDPDIAYGFGESGQVYISNDCGESFRQVEVKGDLPEYRFSGIDGFKGGEIRFLPHEKGVCYMALLTHGLWKLSFSRTAVTAERITEEGDFVKAVGFGRGDEQGVAGIFISGTLFGEYGFWCSYDLGKSWSKINDDSQMYGYIVSMDGDFRKKGRVYIATGTHGGLYGEPVL